MEGLVVRDTRLATATTPVRNTWSSTAPLADLYLFQPRAGKVALEGPEEKEVKAEPVDRGVEAGMVRTVAAHPLATGLARVALAGVAETRAEAEMAATVERPGTEETAL